MKLTSVLCPCARFSIGGKKKDDEEGGESSEPDQKQSRSRNPFLGKSRVPQSQSPGPGVRSQLLESSLILPSGRKKQELQRASSSGWKRNSRTPGQKLGLHFISQVCVTVLITLFFMHMIYNVHATRLCFLCVCTNCTTSQQICPSSIICIHV